MADDASNFRLSDPKDPFSISQALQQTKDLFNPQVTRNITPTTQEEYKNMALNIDPVMSVESKIPSWIQETLNNNRTLGERLMQLGRENKNTFSSNPTPDLSSPNAAIQSYATPDFPMHVTNNLRGSAILGDTLTTPESILSAHQVALARQKGNYPIDPDKLKMTPNGLVPFNHMNDLMDVGTYHGIGGHGMYGENAIVSSPAGNYEMFTAPEMIPNKIQFETMDSVPGKNGQNAIQAMLSSILARDDGIVYDMSNYTTHVNDLIKPSSVVSNIMKHQTAKHIEKSLDAEGMLDLPKALIQQAPSMSDEEYLGTLANRVETLGNKRFMQAMQGEVIPKFRDFDQAHKYMQNIDILDPEVHQAISKSPSGFPTPLQRNGVGSKVLKQIITNQILRDSTSLPENWTQHPFLTGVHHKNGGEIQGYAQGGYVPVQPTQPQKPVQPSKVNNTFMAGGLNLINPSNKNKGPLNVQWNSNNLIAKARAI